MKAYRITYTINGKTQDILIDAKDLKSAKNKIEKKHGCKITVRDYTVIGYF